MNPLKFDADEDRFAELNGLERLIAADDVPLPPEVEARMRAHLEKLQAQIGGLDSNSGTTKEHWIMNLVRKLNQGRVRWATAAVLTGALFIAALVFEVLGINTTSAAYAAVAEQLHKAQVIAYSVVYTFASDQSPLRQEIAFRPPSALRIEFENKGVRLIQIYDLETKQGMLLMPASKSGQLLDVTKMSALKLFPSRIELLANAFADIPEKADAVLDKKSIEGHTVTGFRVGQRIYWIDVNLRKLIRMEEPAGDGKMVASNFRFDPPGLDAAYFSLELPAGYTTHSTQTVQLDDSQLSEADIVEYLRVVSSMIQGRHFPDSFDPLELVNLKNAGKLDPDPEFVKDPAAVSGVISRATQRAFMFVMRFDTSNDWHYAGKGVQRGNPANWIAWWKPSGAENYRVILGDLSVIEATPGEIAKHRTQP